MKIIRTLWELSCFDKTTEELVSEYELHDFDVDTWRSLLDIEGEGLFQGEFRVLPEHVEFLQQYVPDPINVQSCDCFVGFCAEYEWSRKKKEDVPDKGDLPESSSEREV